LWLNTYCCRDSVTVVNRMVDARPCNVFVLLRRVRNCRSIIIIIIIIGAWRIELRKVEDEETRKTTWSRQERLSLYNLGLSFISLTVILIIISLPSPTLSFIPNLNLAFLQILPTAAFLFLLQDRLLLLLLSIRFLLFSFFLFYTF